MGDVAAEDGVVAVGDVAAEDSAVKEGGDKGALKGVDISGDFDIRYRWARLSFLQIRVSSACSSLRFFFSSICSSVRWSHTL